MDTAQRVKAAVISAIEAARKMTPGERRQARKAAKREQAIRNWEREQTR